MKERPIPFTVESSQAITEERKTQTRRLLSPQPIDLIPFKGDQAGRAWVGLLHVDVDPSKNRGKNVRCRYGYPGDRLWVREPWAEVHPVQVSAGRPSLPGRAGIPGPPPVDYRVIYRADGDSYPALHFIDEHPFREACALRCPRSHVHPEETYRGWRNVMFMPRWASRTTLEITEIRAQRLQEITEADALAEGITRWSKDGQLWKYSMGRRHISGELDFVDRWADMPKTAREAYAREWDRINGKRAPWSSNPWVWAITFRLLEVRRAA